MSDGPWKSLPMRPHWKQVAKQAENGAFSPEELSGAVDTALLKDAEELPLERVWRVLVPSDQGILFRPDLDEELESIRRDHPGSKLVQTLLTCLRDQEASGSSGREMVESAVADTLYEWVCDQGRAIQEHYYRRCRSPKIPVDGRLAAARRLCDFRGLASRMVAPSDSSVPSHGPAKRSGLDEGPRL